MQLFQAGTNDEPDSRVQASARSRRQKANKLMPETCGLIASASLVPLANLHATYGPTRFSPFVPLRPHPASPRLVYS